MFLKLEDGAGPVCVNMDTGLRFRQVAKQGLAAGVQIVFPDGHTNIQVRGGYEELCRSVEALPVGNVRE